MKIEAVSLTVDNDPSVENKDFPNQTKTLSDERVHRFIKPSTVLRNKIIRTNLNMKRNQLIFS